MNELLERCSPLEREQTHRTVNRKSGTEGEWTQTQDPS
jgi:hypothetical protein